MAINLELKLSCADADLESYVEDAKLHGMSIANELQQRDTYFLARNGRLKLREIGGCPDTASSFELIAYQRPNTEGTRWSGYERIELDRAQASALREALATTLGIDVVVSKRRRVAFSNRTRVHFDEVDGLGSFIEFETVTLSDDDPTAGQELDRLVQMLALGDLVPIPGSYADLLRSVQVIDDVDRG